MFKDKLICLANKYGSLRKLSKLCKIPYNTLYDYYDSGKPVKVDVIIRISEYTGCSLDWLLMDKGNNLAVNETRATYSIPSNCPADPVCQEICKVCMSLPPDDKEAFRALADILKSDQEKTKTAIKDNLVEFQEKIQWKKQMGSKETNDFKPLKHIGTNRGRGIRN